MPDIIYLCSLNIVLKYVYLNTLFTNIGVEKKLKYDIQVYFLVFYEYIDKIQLTKRHFIKQLIVNIL